MKIDNVPVIGRLNRSINRIMLNFILLSIICFVLGILILMYPKALDVLASALLIIASLVLMNISYNIHHFKQKYTKYFKED